MQNGNGVWEGNGSPFTSERTTRCARRGVVGLCGIVFLVAGLGGANTWARDSASLVAVELPPLPAPVAGAYVGTSNGAVLVAGGVSPAVASPEAASRRHLDLVFVLPPNAEAWTAASPLSAPRAYGAAISFEKSVICVGGTDGERHHSDVFRLTWTRGELQRTELPALPAPTAYCAASVLDKTLYVAGGQAAPGATEGMNAFWSLDLGDANAQWKPVEPWPGPGRILAVLAAQGGSLILVGGASNETGTGPPVQPTADQPRSTFTGQSVRANTGGRAASGTQITGERRQPKTALVDAYRFRPGRGWTRVADAPTAPADVPGVAMGQAHVLIFGAPEMPGPNAASPEDATPAPIFAYHTITDTWTTMGHMPAPAVGGRAVALDNEVVVTGPAERVQRYREIEGRARFGAVNFVVLGVYLAALVGMGAYFSRRENSTDDFFLGGRRVPWWAAGLSIFGTQLSALTFMAIPAKAYSTDWTFLLVNATIVLVAPIVAIFYVPFFRRLEVTTAYEYLERRFNLAARLFGSVVFIALQIGRMGIVLFLPSLALATITGLSVTTCILVMGVLSTLYTVLGGIEAVIWTDVVQVFVLIGGAALCLVLVVVQVGGGASHLVSLAAAEGKFHVFNWTWDYTLAGVWVVLVGNFFATLVPYSSDQTVIQRYLTTADEAKAKQAIWVNAILAVPATLLFFTLGTALFLFYQAHPERLSPTTPTDSILPWFIARNLPVGVSGLVVAGLFAAAMSSLDSSMNSGASAIVTDFYRRLGKRNDEERCLRLARWITVILGAIGTGTALWMASSGVASLWDAFIKLMGLVGGSLAGMFALGIFTRARRGNGAIIGAVTSAIVVYCVQRYTDVHFFLYAAVGVVSCMVVGYVSSRIVSGPGGSLEGLTAFTTPLRQPPRTPGRRGSEPPRHKDTRKNYQ